MELVCPAYSFDPIDQDSEMKFLSKDSALIRSRFRFESEELFSIDNNNFENYICPFSL